MKTKLTRRGQTVVPSAIRKRFNLKESSTLQWMVEGDVITVLPVPRDPVEKLQGALKGVVSFQEFMEDRRADRELEQTRDGS